MEILIHGTKHGYKVLYKTKGFPSTFARDMRREDVKNTRTTVGQFTYSIAFSNGGFIFSKYLGVWDSDRKAIGNIIFSVYIPGNKHLSGKDLINLLNELSEKYWNKYIGEEGNIHNTEEDWTIFDAIANNYELLNYDIEDIQKGEGEAAFIYYTDGMELQKYFDAPYQEEYSAHKQVFFVERKLKGMNENPLNALKHNPTAELEINLENPKYRLLFNLQAKGGVRIDVKVNGKPRLNKDRVRRKEELVITWSKPFYNTKEIRGRWNEISSDYLIKDDSEQKLTVVEIDLYPIEYTFIFETKDRFFNTINDAEIILKCKGYGPELNVKENKIILTEEELQNSWTVIAKKNNLISEQRDIRIEDANRNIPLTLYERKKVIFHISDENQQIHNYNIQIAGKKVQHKDGEVEFIGEDIDKKLEIIISHKDYNTGYFSFSPKDNENPKYTLTKQQQTGKRVILKENDDGKIEIPKSVLISLAVLILIIFMGLYALNKKYKPGDEEHDERKTEIAVSIINEYVNGIELNKDTLERYRSNYCIATPPENSDKTKQSWWQIIWPFGSKDNLSQQQETQVIPDLCKKIDDAIALRSAINYGEIDKLKNITYSNSQQDFETAINSIEDKFINSISDTLHNRMVSKMNLNEIAGLIQKVQNGLIVKENTKQETAENSGKVQDVFNKNKKEQPVENQPKVKQETQTQKSSKEKISLKDEFWGLVNSGDIQKTKYDGILKKYKSEGGDIITYLNKICKSTASFKDFKTIPEMTRKKAITLTELENN